jgi:DNA-binding NtrC family response regulator
MDHAILVVDDERDFLETVRRGLMISGFQNIVLLADSQEAAKRVERGERYDVALLDITMPGMNGLKLLECIKAVSSATQCIMITAICETEIAEECMRKGAFDYLIKPFSREELVRRIECALQQGTSTESG